jgi:hypothetical protein
MNTTIHYMALYNDDYGIDRLINTGSHTTCCISAAETYLSDKYSEENP